MLGAPTAVEQSVLRAVVTQPPRSVDNIGREHLRTKCKAGATNAVEPSKSPQSLTIAVPFLIIDLVIAAKETIQRNRSGPVLIHVKDIWIGVVLAVLPRRNIKVAGNRECDTFDGRISDPEGIINGRPGMNFTIVSQNQQ